MSQWFIKSQYYYNSIKLIFLLILFLYYGFSYSNSLCYHPSSSILALLFSDYFVCPCYLYYCVSSGLPAVVMEFVGRPPLLKQQLLKRRSEEEQTEPWMECDTCGQRYICCCCWWWYGVGLVYCWYGNGIWHLCGLGVLVECHMFDIVIDRSTILLLTLCVL